MRLKGKVAVINGAASRMGRAIALGYAQEGADLFLQDFPRNDGKLLIVDSSGSNRSALLTALGELEHELIEAETTSQAV